MYGQVAVWAIMLAWGFALGFIGGRRDWSPPKMFVVMTPALIVMRAILKASGLG